VTKSVAQEQKEQKIETRTAVERIASVTIVATAVAVLTVLVFTAVYALDKYSQRFPSSIAFSDFRGYEDWAVVSSARTDEVLKVIVGNPTMINAYRTGVSGQRPAFPGWLHDREAPVEAEKSTEAPFVVEVQPIAQQVAA
jgi:hypothetical protein